MASGISLARRVERHVYQHGVCEAIGLASCTFWLLFLAEKKQLATLVLWVLPPSSIAFVLVAPILALAGTVSALWYMLKKGVSVSSAVPRILLGLVFLWVWWRSTPFFELP